MSDRSSIEWTEATWNPVTGCTKVSSGCANCYAETFAERFRGVPNHPYEQGFDLRLWPERLDLPLRWRTPRRIFVNSMSDLFHEEVPDEFIDRVFDTMRSARRHLFQVLTKRTERLVDYIATREKWWGPLHERLPNVWLGTSVETHKYMDRALFVSRLSSTVRFLSCEPLLGSLDLTAILREKEGINWVIVGGESGPRARPMAKKTGSPRSVISVSRRTCHSSSSSGVDSTRRRRVAFWKAELGTATRTGTLTTSVTPKRYEEGQRRAVWNPLR